MAFNLGRGKRMITSGSWHVDSMMIAAIGIWIVSSFRLMFYVWLASKPAIAVQFDLREPGLKLMTFATIIFSCTLLVIFIDEILPPGLPKHVNFFITWLWFFARALFPAGIVWMFGTALKGGIAGGLSEELETKKEWVQRQL